MFSTGGQTPSNRAVKHCRSTVPGTSALDHLHENLRAAQLQLSDEAVTRLDAIDNREDQ
jgi:aryl-alcohol dehydrogenase-like predicted oxidoreductase